MVNVARNSDVRIDKLALGPYGTNAYIITCLKTRDSALIDTPAEADKILDRLKGTSPKYILLTHNHFDHLGALAELYSKLKVPLAAHAADASQLPIPPERLLNDGDMIPLGKLKLEVIHTPGHTPGSLCFRYGRYLLAGDTIFPGGPGKTASPAAFSEIIKSITGKFFTLPEDTTIFPGHGDSTTVKKTKEEFAVFSSRPHGPDLCGDVLWLST